MIVVSVSPFWSVIVTLVTFDSKYSFKKKNKNIYLRREQAQRFNCVLSVPSHIKEVKKTEDIKIFLRKIMHFGNTESLDVCR